MRPIILLLIFALAPVGVAAGTGVAREIDSARSYAEFSVTHVFVERVTGTVPIVRGTVLLPADSTIPISVSAVLDPTRIKTGEDDRDGALQTSDWFDTKQFPVWTFTSTKVTLRATSSFVLEGLLTIHGIAQSERLDVSVTGPPAHPLYHASGTIDRHAFGMPPTRLDPAIGNPVTVTLDVALQ